jgi:N-acetylmuramoyl-L-alanine amidase
MIVFLDRQHHGKPNRWGDCGASNDGVHETWLTAQYIHHCEWKLREAGIDVCVLSDGWYKDRHQRVNQYARGHDKSVYVSCHINAGGGDYGATFYDHRSTNGQRLATHINGRLHQWCDPLHNKTKQIAARPDDWTSNAFNTIKRVSSPVAVCFEPFFIDCENHKSLTSLSGLELVGTALAVGIKSYLED